MSNLNNLFRAKLPLALSVCLVTAISQSNLSAQAQNKQLAATTTPGSSLASPSTSSTLKSPAGTTSAAPAAAAAVSDREQDGLAGPVRRVRTETAKLTPSGGKQIETPRALLEVAAYDVKGNKIDNAYYPSSGGALTGKEVYQYDDKGNMTEMSLFGADGSLLSKETYSYEFDNNGNWIKMTTSVAVVEGGKISFEPSEITYRTITYYLGGATPAKPNQLTATNNGAASSSPATVKATNNGAAPAAAQPTAAANGANGKNGKSMMLPSASSSLDKTAVINASDASFSGATSTGTGSEVVALEAEPPSKPFRRGPTRPISGGVLNGTATELPKPAYPEVARRARSSGLVTVEVVVDEKGHVISAHAVKGPTLLQQAAEAAAMQARFSPTLLSGQAVKVSGIITYNFVYGGQ